MNPELDADDVRELLVELGERLLARGVRAELYVVGGAAMALAYDARRSTRDVDGVFKPRDEVLEEARAMALDRGLSRHWLSEGVRDYWPSTPDEDPEPVLDEPGIAVSVASPHHLLGMKIMSARPGGDVEDAVFLARLLGISRESELLAVAEHVWGSTLPDASLRFVEEVERGVATGVAPVAPPTIAGAFVPPYATRVECGAWMPRARRRCSLPPHASGQHR